MFSTQLVSQVVEERSKSSFDSILLSQDCKMLEEDLGKVFTKTEILTAFPGGGEKWFEFANKNFDFNSVVEKINDSTRYFEDSIVVKFIVTREGNICVISLISGNIVLFEPVKKLLRNSPTWVPASSNRNLNAYRTLRVDVFIDKKNNVMTIKKNYNSYLRNND